MKQVQQIVAKNDMSLKQVWQDKKVLKQEIVAGLTGFFCDFLYHLSQPDDSQRCWYSN